MLYICPLQMGFHDTFDAYLLDQWILDYQLKFISIYCTAALFATPLRIADNSKCDMRPVSNSKRVTVNRNDVSRLSHLNPPQIRMGGKAN